MHKFPINNYRTFAELPFDKFNTFNFSVYLLDFDWNYRFINNFALQNLDKSADELLGKSMWQMFPQLEKHPVFNQIREKLQRRTPCSYETISLLNGKRLYITGFPLDDCFYFTSSILPDKQELINEIRNELLKRNS